MTAVIAYALGVERLSRRFWIAAAISFAGVVLVAAGSGRRVLRQLGRRPARSSATATWGAYTVAIVPLLRLYSVWRISAGALVMGAIPLF